MRIASSLGRRARGAIRRTSRGTTPDERYTACRAAMLTTDPAPYGAVAILGDSLTEHLDAYLHAWRVSGGAGCWGRAHAARRLVLQGIGGETARGLATRLRLAGGATTVVVEIGVNDLNRHLRPPDAVCADILAVHAALIAGRPGRRVIVQTIAPTRGAPLNADIRAANAGLRAAAVELLDVWPCLADGAGMLDARYTTDGLHLNARGMDRWLAALCPIVFGA